MSSYIIEVLNLFSQKINLNFDTLLITNNLLNLASSYKLQIEQFMKSLLNKEVKLLQDSKKKDQFDQSFDATHSFTCSHDNSQASDLCLHFLVNQLISSGSPSNDPYPETRNISLQLKCPQIQKQTLSKAESQKLLISKENKPIKVIEKENKKKHMIEEEGKLIKHKKIQEVKLKIKLNSWIIGEEIFSYQGIKRVSLTKDRMKSSEDIMRIWVGGEKEVELSIDGKKTQNNFPNSYFILAKFIERVLKMNSKFYEIGWEKTGHIQKSVVLDSYIFGLIYKKSQHKGQWKERYVVISPQKLQSYKNPNKMEKPSFVIQKKHIKSIYTKFQLFSELLVIGIRHGSLREKETEFAITPAYLFQKNGKNWLFQFFRLLH